MNKVIARYREKSDSFGYPDESIGESSACATALLCGVKANFETVGLDIRGKFGNCTSSFVSRVDSLIDWTQQEGETERNHYFKA
ncbi:hypothetical protein J6590_095679 [Homalodisca vitripennis]|nr:hypothetical protein J6590_095679 [Homalodisca vitripennis]